MLSRILHLSFWLATLFISSSALADIAVFVHGYQSAGHTWRKHGIIPTLVANGWKDAGTYYATPYSVVHYGPAIENNSVLTVELPSEAPVEIQAGLLHLYLLDITAHHPDQSIRLIAHSAGGIVSRLVLVGDPNLPITQLITIATPHMGSPVAEMAEMAATTPVSLFSSIAGFDNLDKSKRLYSQLGREKENYFLFWLNRQPHPDIDYVAIVRADDSLLKGDVVVPPYSQDITRIPAIGKKARIILTPGRHKLKSADGLLILPLLFGG